MKQLDLNCDMGELKTNQLTNFDQEIMPFISSCNVACGFHSGHPQLIEETILHAIKHKVKIGAHPSYNDRENFGRKSMTVEPKKLKAELRYQISALKSMAESLGVQLNHVKPHGALYNDMANNQELAELFITVVKEIDQNLIIYGLAHSIIIDCCAQENIKVVNEGFADRKYDAINQLRSRQYNDAVIYQPENIISQINGFLNGTVELWDGTKTSIKIDSICLHSDTKNAVNLSKIIYNYLTNQSIEICATT